MKPKLKKYIQNYTMKALFISFITLSHIVFGQVKITYEVTYKPDSTSDSRNKEEMILKHFEGKSYFYNYTKFKLDSIYNRVTAEYVETGIAPNVSLKYELRFGTYKDFNKQELYEIQDLHKYFMFKIPTPKQDWKIENKTKKIFDYTCRKATLHFGGRQWEAWYAEDLPIPDGPYKFSGLPGLILEIYDKPKDYHFLAIGIIKEQKEVKLPKETVNTTQENFIKLKNNLIKDPALFVRESTMRNSNVTMKGTDGRKMEYKELYDRITEESNNFMKTHNNPIEKNTIWIR